MEKRKLGLQHPWPDCLICWPYASISEVKFLTQFVILFFFFFFFFFGTYAVIGICQSIWLSGSQAVCGENMSFFSETLQNLTELRDDKFLLSLHFHINFDALDQISKFWLYVIVTYIFM